MSDQAERDLEARLAEALRVEPSHEFLPRVRARLATEAPAQPFGWLGWAALVTASVVAIALVFRPTPEPAPRPVPQARTAPVEAPVVTAPAVAMPAEVPARGARRRAAEPEVMLPPGQEQAVRQFLDALQALDRPAAAPEAPELSPLQFADVRVEPLEVEPLARSDS